MHSGLAPDEIRSEVVVSLACSGAVDDAFDGCSILKRPRRGNEEKGMFVPRAKGRKRGIDLQYSQKRLVLTCSRVCQLNSGSLQSRCLRVRVISGLEIKVEAL